jgi:hypothetical protein
MRSLLISRWVLHKLTARDGYEPMNYSAAAEGHGASLDESLGGYRANAHPVRRSVDCTNSGLLEDSAPQPSPSAPPQGTPRRPRRDASSAPLNLVLRSELQQGQTEIGQGVR